jgi:hypothetical protein
LGGTRQGYPPLSDFFVLDPDEKKAICFCLASTHLLKAVFDPKVIEDILEEEEKKAQAKKSPPLKKAELQVILGKLGNPKTQMANIEPIMNFKRTGISKKTIVYTDNKTHIRHKMQMPNQSPLTSPPVKK